MDKQNGRGEYSRPLVEVRGSYPGYPAGVEFAVADARAREFMAHALNRARGRFEVQRAAFIDAGKLLYLEDFSAVGRQLDAVLGKLLHGEYAAGGPAGALQLAAADAEFLIRVDELAAALEALRSSSAPVRELDTALAVAVRLQAVVERRFAAPPAGDKA